MNINWDGLKSRNLFADYAGGLEAGREMKTASAKREALNIFATDPAKAEQLLIGAGDITGAEALAKRAERQRLTKARTEATGLVAKGDYKTARQNAIASGDFDMASAIGKLAADQREAAATQADELAGFAEHLKTVPDDQRRDAIARAAPLLIERGFTHEKIRTFDPTDQGLDAVIRSSMDLKTALAQSNKDRDFGLDQERFGETQRSNRVGEAQRAQSNATSAYSAQTGRMSFEERRRAGGFGTPGVGGVIGPDLDPNEWEIEQ